MEIMSLSLRSRYWEIFMFGIIKISTFFRVARRGAGVLEVEVEEEARARVRGNELELDERRACEEVLDEAGVSRRRTLPVRSPFM